tara:strand:+ start:91300 stop:91863 length:564 start_codon:yes stop_codon:yes gene_type:complete
MMNGPKKNGKVWGGLCLLLPILFSFIGIPDKVMVKVRTSIVETYATGEYHLLPISVPESLQPQLAVDFQGGRLQQILVDKRVLGYAYIGEAASMKNKFDYVIFFDADLNIKKAKVLIYREDYGRQIGSQRWLKQYIGLGPEDTVAYGKTVDAISGATISAKSMAMAVDGMLRSLSVLRANNMLNTDK